MGCGASQQQAPHASGGSDVEPFNDNAIRDENVDEESTESIDSGIEDSETSSARKSPAESTDRCATGDAALNCTRSQNKTAIAFEISFDEGRPKPPPPKHVGRYSRHAEVTEGRNRSEKQGDPGNKRHEDVERRRELGILQVVASQRRRQLHAQKVAARRKALEFSAESSDENEDLMEQDQTFNQDHCDFDWGND